MPRPVCRAYPMRVLHTGRARGAVAPSALEEASCQSRICRDQRRVSRPWRWPAVRQGRSESSLLPQVGGPGRETPGHVRDPVGSPATCCARRRGGG